MSIGAVKIGKGFWGSGLIVYCLGLPESTVSLVEVASELVEYG